MFYAKKRDKKVSIPQAVWIACNNQIVNIGGILFSVSIPQAVWIACNGTSDSDDVLEDAVSIPQAVWIACNQYDQIGNSLPFGFNTASGMDCMQYCLPEALETVSPEVGFLILTPFSRFSPKCAELFCREKCFERGLKPVIARALLSTKEI